MVVYKAPTRNRSKTSYIVVHCSATRPSQNIGAKEIDKIHRGLGWSCIGYHYVIRRDGTVEEGRMASQIGSHVEGFNSVSLGVCLVGGVTEKDVNKAENNFTEEQFNSLRTLLSDLKEQYPEAVIQGHRDFPKVRKDCPCFDVREWLNQ